ncbi:MAG: hypothetical protein IT381_13600 [Deltaproteobacteria bacterium]|nr:hypothetical protein [Deltaproteobacteria bacterium]
MPELPDAYRERFAPIAFLGAGFIGGVFSARDQESDAVVALKVPMPRFAHDPSIGLVFGEEADNMEALAHVPRLLRLHACALGGAPFIATELLSGGNVANLLFGDGKPLDYAAAVAIAAGLLETLALLQAAGRYQMDLHLGNLMFATAPASAASLRIIDLQRCFATSGVSFYQHFPLPPRRVSKRDPRRGVWFGIDGRNAQMIAAHLVGCLTAKLLPPRRNVLARHYSRGLSFAGPRRRFERVMPARLAAWVSDRSFFDGPPFELDLQTACDEMCLAAGLPSPRFQQAPAAPAAALPKMPERFTTPLVTTSAMLRSPQWQAWLEAREPQRGLWLQSVQRPRRAEVGPSVIFDLLRGLYTQRRVSKPSSRARLDARLRAVPEAAAIFAKHQPEWGRELGFSVNGASDADALAALLRALCEAYGSVILSIEGYDVLHPTDAALVADLVPRLSGLPLLMLVGNKS